MTITLKLEGIEKCYRSAKAIDGVSLDMKGGSITVLLGVNGAGKSTLLRILAGLESADKGTIVFNGQKTSSDQLRKIATLVFQKTTMFSRSVYDNLAFGLKIRNVHEPDIKQKISDALQAVGLAGFENRKAKKLSGGEQQRISLARAFLLDPKILLLDEPTANLDPNSSRVIEKAILSRKNPETIIVLATHNLGQAKRLGDEVVHIHEGRVVEAAPPKELFDNPKCEVTRKFISGELEF